jgi:hypothetical protein
MPGKEDAYTQYSHWQNIHIGHMDPNSQNSPSRTLVCTHAIYMFAPRLESAQDAKSSSQWWQTLGDLMAPITICIFACAKHLLE